MWEIPADYRMETRTERQTRNLISPLFIHLFLFFFHFPLLHVLLLSWARTLKHTTAFFLPLMPFALYSSTLLILGSLHDWLYNATREVNEWKLLLACSFSALNSNVMRVCVSEREADSLPDESVTSNHFCHSSPKYGQSFLPDRWLNANCRNKLGSQSSQVQHTHKIKKEMVICLFMIHHWTRWNWVIRMSYNKWQKRLETLFLRLIHQFVYHLYCQAICLSAYQLSVHLPAHLSSVRFCSQSGFHSGTRILPRDFFCVCDTVKA